MLDVQRIELHRTQQRLHAQEPQCSRRTQQLGHIPIRFLLVADGGSQPDVCGRFAIKPTSRKQLTRGIGVVRRQVTDIAQSLHDVADAFGQQQKVQLLAFGDQLKQIQTPLHRHLVVEDIREGCTEHTGTHPVLQRLCIPAVHPIPGAGLRAMARLASPPSHAQQIAGHVRLCIAEIARGADLGATDPGVESVGSPLDFRVFSHHARPWGMVLLSPSI